MRQTIADLKHENDKLKTDLTAAEMNNDGMRDRLQQIINKHKVDQQTAKDAFEETINQLQAQMKENETIQAKSNDKIKSLMDRITNIERHDKQEKEKLERKTKSNANENGKIGHEKMDSAIPIKTGNPFLPLTNFNETRSVPINTSNPFLPLSDLDDTGNTMLQSGNTENVKSPKEDNGAEQTQKTLANGRKFFPLAVDRPVLVHDSIGRNIKGHKLLTGSSV